MHFSKPFGHQELKSYAGINIAISIQDWKFKKFLERWQYIKEFSHTEKQKINIKLNLQKGNSMDQMDFQGIHFTLRPVYLKACQIKAY